MNLLQQLQEGGQPQGGQEDQMQQIIAQVAQMLQQGMAPEEVAQQLIQMGIPEEQVSQIIQMVMQQMQGGQPQMQLGAEVMGPPEEKDWQAQQNWPGPPTRPAAPSENPYENLQQNWPGPPTRPAAPSENPYENLLEELAPAGINSYDDLDYGNWRNPNSKYQQGGQPQEGGDQMDQVLQQVAQMLQEGADPQEVLAQLVQLGIPEDQASQIIEMVMQQMQGGQPQQQPQMQSGGEFRNTSGLFRKLFKK